MDEPGLTPEGSNGGPMTPDWTVLARELHEAEEQHRASPTPETAAKVAELERRLSESLRTWPGGRPGIEGP